MGVDLQADSREQLHCSKPVCVEPQFALWGWVFPQDHTQSFLSLSSPGSTLLGRPFGSLFSSCQNPSENEKQPVAWSPCSLPLE